MEFYSARIGRFVRSLTGHRNMYRSTRKFFLENSFKKSNCCFQPQASVLCGFHIPFQLVYEGVRLPSPPF